MENTAGGSFRKHKLLIAVLGVASISLPVVTWNSGWDYGNASDCLSCEKPENVSEAVGKAAFLLFLYGRPAALPDTASAAA